MANLISIQEAVDNFKELIESSIIEGGIAAKEAMIRSSKPINNILHDFFCFSKNIID